jgi:hypothetical protein
MAAYGAMAEEYQEVEVGGGLEHFVDSVEVEVVDDYCVMGEEALAMVLAVLILPPSVLHIGASRLARSRSSIAVERGAAM